MTSTAAIGMYRANFAIVIGISGFREMNRMISIIRHRRLLRLPVRILQLKDPPSSVICRSHDPGFKGS